MPRRLHTSTMLPAIILALVACTKTDKSTAAGIEEQKITHVSPCAHPLLWKIHGQRPSYVFGTIHVPDDRVLALSKSVTNAIDGCDELNTEIPMDMGTQLSTATKMMLPDGKTLEQVLPKKLYKKLEGLFTAKGFPFAPLNRMKIWAITAQVVLLDHLLEFSTKKPLDMVIYLRAQKNGKRVGGIETVEEQLSVFDSLTIKEQVRMLQQTLDQLDEFRAKGSDPVTELLDAYLKGDEKNLYDTMMETYDPTNPLDKKIMKRLFFDRNIRMADRMAAKLKKNEKSSFFFAVGAGHLLGDQGVVSLLRKKGFKLTRVK